MTRSQIVLESRHVRYLKRVAQRNNTSMSAEVRRALDQQMAAETKEHDPLLDLVGMASGPETDLSENHDHYLYGAARQRR